MSAFPIARRWPPRHADRIQLYSFPTPNGIKVSATLEELGLPYDAHRIDIVANETWTDDFLSLNPNGKIPAILDPNGPGGAPVALFESGAIMLYLADKTGRLLPSDPVRRYEAIQWLFFQNTAIGPIFGQLGYFHAMGGRQIEDRRPLDRFAAETRRLLGVLDARLAGRTWIMGDELTIADFAIYGWANILVTFYDARALAGFDDLANVPAWLDRMLARPAVQRGMAIPREDAPARSD